MPEKSYMQKKRGSIGILTLGAFGGGGSSGSKGGGGISNGGKGVEGQNSKGKLLLYITVFTINSLLHLRQQDFVGRRKGTIDLRWSYKNLEYFSIFEAI